MKTLLTALMLSTAAALAAPAIAQEARNVVLVHGAFADETSWDKVAQLLADRGYNVTQVANPLTSLADDVAATRAAIDAQDGPVVLVAHSWGGVVIGEAGNDAKVKALVYVSAFAPDKGESIAKLSEGGQPSEGQKAIRPNDQGQLIFDPAAFPALFAGDVPVAEAEAMAASQLPSNPANFATDTVVAAWNEKPSFYVVTTADQVIPADVQRFFAGRMNATVTEIDASHAGIVSQPEAVAKAIEDAAL